jgi:hypothetical protein
MLCHVVGDPREVLIAPVDLFHALRHMPLVQPPPLLRAGHLFPELLVQPREIVHGYLPGLSLKFTDRAPRQIRSASTHPTL